MQSRNILLAFFICLSCMSCVNETNKERTKGIKAFMKKDIKLPFDVMDKRDCAMFRDSTSARCVYLIKWLEASECTPCMASNIANNEALYLDQNKNVEFVYIINSHQHEVEEIYRGLCSKRVKGTVYLDTCNAFFKANPHIPESELYHTFVINKQGKVLMVGNPFKNQPMRTLLDKVIAREQKKEK